jgi:Cellulose binding domain
VGEATRRRGRGRHTSSVGAAPGGRDQVDRAFEAWPTWPAHRPGLGAGGARVYIRGEEPRPAADTVVLGGLSRAWPALPAAAVTPVRPRYRKRGRGRWLALVGAGLALIVVAGYLGVPPLLSALGLGPPVVCRVCQLPIPSSAAIGAGAGASATPSSSRPRPSSPARTASATTSAPAVPVAVPPPATATGSAPPPALEVSYTAIPDAGGFTGQVTVVNQGPATISGWRLVVALPGDTVSAVQNAEFTEDQGVLSMTPAPYDLFVAPGNEVTVSIYASGPVRTPTECTFNDVACR